MFRRALGSVNPLIEAVPYPPILQARTWLAGYDGRHGPPIDLTQAVPGYPAHPELVERLTQAAHERGVYGYGPIVGDPALREAYAAELTRLYGGEIGPDEIAITTGANMASFAVTLLLARAGEAVMLPAPWYFNHQMNAGLLGIEVVPLPCRAEAGFVPEPGEAERLLHSRVKAIMLVTPNNPTGAVYPPETIAAFSDLCRARGIHLVLDETYRDFRDGSDGPHGLFASGRREHLIQLYSFSKSYCVPGFRAGAVTAAPEILPAFTKILDCLQICAPRVGQAGLAWAIPALRDWRERNRRLMAERAAACRSAFSALPGWRVDAQGAYFAYLRHPFAGISSWQVAERLAAEQGLVTLPGEAFGPGQERHLRLAFANVEAGEIGEVARRLASLASPEG